MSPTTGADDMTYLYTVKANHLIRDAEQIERDAEQSLQAWIILGQGDKYGVAMSKARALRAAASERSVATRREILRNSGFVVKTA
jgi:hypothetical protein